MNKLPFLVLVTLLHTRAAMAESAITCSPGTTPSVSEKQRGCVGESSKKEGVWEKLSVDGVIFESQVYRGGRLDGLKIEYYPSGAKKCEEKVIGLTEQEISKQLTENSAPSYGEERRDYRNVGPRQCWFEDGHKKEESTFDDRGNIAEQKMYDVNGTLISEGHFINGARHGVQRSWFADGKPMMLETFASGRRQGSAEYYSADGKTREGAFNYDQRQGIWRYYSPDGSLRYELVFDQDSEVGVKSGKALYELDIKTAGQYGELPPRVR